MVDSDFDPDDSLESGHHDDDRRDDDEEEDLENEESGNHNDYVEFSVPLESKVVRHHLIRDHVVATLSKSRN